MKVLDAIVEVLLAVLLAAFVWGVVVAGYHASQPRPPVPAPCEAPASGARP
jgi:hypothetical protein